MDERKIERAGVREKERQRERERQTDRERDNFFRYSIRRLVRQVDSFFLIKYPSILLKVNKVVIRKQIKSDRSYLYT